MVKNTFKIIERLQNDTFKGMFHHFFNFMYEINISEDKRPSNFYRMLQKALLKKFWLVFQHKQNEG